MRLFFTPGGDNVYGQWDMHETLPENYWHYYYGDGVQYPSCAGLSAKYITEIRVYSVPQGDWTLALDGQDIGGLQYEVSKTYFESALACQFKANHKASYTDSKGRLWEGMPLWFLLGFVDDADQHSSKAFNDVLAKAGYQVVITAADGHSITIDSTDIDRNHNYIIANSLDGALIPESDSSWPLRLVGANASGATSISQIVSIKLLKSFKDWPLKYEPVHSTHDWNIIFSLPVSKTQNLDDHIYVTDVAGKKEPVTCKVNPENPKGIQVSPPQGGYQPGGSYTLWIDGSLESEGGKLLKQPYKLQFKIAN
jgi:hypothetical protein